MFRKFLKDYFTFSKTERNGLIVLIVIITLLIAARIIIPHIRRNIIYDFSEYQDEINEFEKSLQEKEISARTDGASGPGTDLKFFDPNSTTPEEMENAGLDSRVIRNILKYREKGGRFRYPEDLRKIYGLDSAEYLRIEQYIIIKADKAAADFVVESKTTDTGSSYKSLKSIALVPLNTSDSAGLANVYGIGPVLSARIIKYRNLLGGYISKDQLLEVYGMTSENFENIKDLVYVDSSAINCINLNKADFEELCRHPYLNDYQARAILSYREIKGRFIEADEIIRNGLLPDDIYKKIRPYLLTE